jgi:hypothetical protein
MTSSYVIYRLGSPDMEGSSEYVEYADSGDNPGVVFQLAYSDIGML